MLCCHLAQINGDKKATIDDFMVGKYIDRKEQKPKQTVKQMAAIFKNYARMHNAYLKQQRRKQGIEPSPAKASAT